MSNVQKLKELTELAEGLHEKRKDLVKIVFQEQCKAVFKTWERLQDFSWVQYTPYFNDGSPCVFRCQNDYFTMHFNNLLHPVSVYRNEIRFDQDHVENGALECATEINENVFSIFSEDDFLELFGDHVRIVVTNDEVRIEEYEHE